MRKKNTIKDWKVREIVRIEKNKNKKVREKRINEKRKNKYTLINLNY
jgi:hypothetical protein